MKNILLSCFLFTFLSTSSFAQWVSVPTTVSTKLESVYFWNNTDGIMSCQNGTIKTTDGGNTWINPGGGFFGFRDIDFANSTTGYAAGITGLSVKKTVNAGTTWSSLTPVNSTSMWGVSAPDANTAYFSGGGVIWKTINGGTSVTSVSSPSGNYMVDIDFVSATEGYVADQIAGIYKTTNGGTSWTPSYPSTGTLYTSLYFLDANTGFACGSNGKIVRTTNAGLNWTDLTTGSTSYLQYIHFYDANHGICVGIGGEVLRTTNGGNTWFHDNIPLPKTLYACILLSPTVAIVAGDSGIVYRNGNLTTSIDEKNPLKNISVSPNPVHDVLIINSECSNYQELSLQVYTLDGKNIQTLTGTFSGDAAMFEVYALKPGFYLGEFECMGHTGIFKFIKY